MSYQPTEEEIQKKMVEIQPNIDMLVRIGIMEEFEKDGETAYRLTEEGKEHAKEIMG